MMKITAQTTGDVVNASIAQPGARVSLQCWCQGQLLIMLGHYGWILPLDDINHSASKQTDGKVYVHKRDIVGGAQLAEGDMVGFYLYADDQGLGAEEVCCLETDMQNPFNAEAAEFVPPPPGLSSWSLDANEFVPAQTVIMETPAVKTVPFGSNANMSNLGRLQSVFAINLAYLSDDSSDDEDSDHELTPRLPTGKQARQRCLSPTASTSAGLSSDDEDFPEACLGDQTFRPPPGLALPSAPCRLALGILARAGLSVEQDHEQHEQQHKKLPPWRRDSKLTSSVSEQGAWTPPWRRAEFPPLTVA